MVNDVCTEVKTVHSCLMSDGVKLHVYLVSIGHSTYMLVVDYETRICMYVAKQFRLQS